MPCLMLTSSPPCFIQMVGSFWQVLMSRSSDIRLELGFHCVVNRSQKNIDEKMSREDLWAKEKDIFTKNDRMKGCKRRTGARCD